MAAVGSRLSSSPRRGAGCFRSGILAPEIERRDDRFIAPGSFSRRFRDPRPHFAKFPGRLVDAALHSGSVDHTRQPRPRYDRRYREHCSESFVPASTNRRCILHHHPPRPTTLTNASDSPLETSNGRANFAHIAKTIYAKVLRPIHITAPPLPGVRLRDRVYRNRTPRPSGTPGCPAGCHAALPRNRIPRQPGDVDGVACNLVRATGAAREYSRELRHHWHRHRDPRRRHRRFADRDAGARDDSRHLTRIFGDPAVPPDDCGPGSPRRHGQARDRRPPNLR